MVHINNDIDLKIVLENYLSHCYNSKSDKSKFSKQRQTLYKTFHLWSTKYFAYIRCEAVRLIFHFL